jgi:DNA-binding response OmpR family regulator
MNKLSNVRVLVVEDDAAIAMLIEDMLDELGYEIGASVARLAKAFEVLDSLDFDVAILDVNVDGEPVFPLARRLSEQGKPIVFSTGYGRAGLPAEFANYPVLAKPFSMSELQRVLETVA